MDPKSEYDVIMEDEVKIAAVVPTRANSTRVRHKNTRKFGDSSLLSLTLAKLKQVRSIPVSYTHLTLPTIYSV